MGKSPPELREKKLIVRGGGGYFECRGIFVWDGSASSERVK